MYGALLVKKEVIYKVVADREGRSSLLCCARGEVQLPDRHIC